MDSSELSRIERQTRWVYEWSRARRALLGFAPATILVTLAVARAAPPWLTLSFGALLFLWGAALLWQGRELKYSVLPDVAAGLLPLSLAICANRIGHVCLEGSCTMLCVHRGWARRGHRPIGCRPPLQPGTRGVDGDLGHCVAHGRDGLCMYRQCGSGWPPRGLLIGWRAVCLTTSLATRAPYEATTYRWAEAGWVNSGLYG